MIWSHISASRFGKSKGGDIRLQNAQGGATFSQPGDDYRCIDSSRARHYPERDYADDGGLIAYGR